MLLILPIAHKYCMETIETSIMNRLKQASTTAAYVDLMVASRIVDSEPLHQHALKGLVSSRPKPDLVQATRIGVAPYHTVMTAALQASDATVMASYKTAEQLGRELMLVKKKLANAKSQLAELNEAEEAPMAMRFGPY
jgi:SUMO ligase MMS21 Smc5/6 complex component